MPINPELVKIPERFPSSSGLYHLLDESATSTAEVSDSKDKELTDDPRI